MNSIKVRAVAGRKLPALDASGAPILGRFVGYTKAGAVDPEGTTVDVSPYILRALKNGDIEEVS